MNKVVYVVKKDILGRLKHTHAGCKSSAMLHCTSLHVVQSKRVNRSFGPKVSRIVRRALRRHRVPLVRFSAAAEKRSSASSHEASKYKVTRSIRIKMRNIFFIRFYLKGFSINHENQICTFCSGQSLNHPISKNCLE